MAGTAKNMHAATAKAITDNFFICFPPVCCFVESKHYLNQKKPGHLLSSLKGFSMLLDPRKRKMEHLRHDDILISQRLVNHFLDFFGFLGCIDAQHVGAILVTFQFPCLAISTSFP
jgi:hypothetical protein